MLWGRLTMRGTFEVKEGNDLDTAQSVYDVLRARPSAIPSVYTNLYRYAANHPNTWVSI